YRHIALTSFIGYAFSQSLGFPLLAGGSVRYRLYSAWGLSTGEIARVIVFSALTFWLGAFTVSGIALIFDPRASAISAFMRASAGVPFGVLFVGLVCVYLVWCARTREPIKIRDWSFAVPPFRLALSQVAISSFDWVLAAAVFYVLLPKAPGLS